MKLPIPLGSAVARRVFRRALIVAFTACCATTPLRAQADSTLRSIAPGTRVLVATTPAGRWPRSRAHGSTIAWFVSASRDSLYLRLPGSPPFAIARDSIDAVWVSRGRSRLHSALWSGAFIGAVSALVTLNDRGDRWRGSERVAFGAGGFAFGAVWGASFPVERWARARP